MASEATVKQKPGLLSPITLPIAVTLSVVGYIFVSTILGAILDFIGQWLGWWGADHMLNVLAADIAYLGDNFTQSIFGEPPAQLAVAIATKVRDSLTLSTHIGGQDYAFMRWVKSMVLVVEPIWQNIVYSAMSVMVRSFIVIMSSAFFLIVFLVTMVDGLVERELRKVGGGIEHAQLYHISKKWAKRILVISPIVYLAWPTEMNPAIIIIPSAALFGFAVYMTFATFKKYL